MYLRIFVIRSYVGIIQIRSMGRSYELPLSLSHKLPCEIYIYQYRKSGAKCQCMFRNL